MKKFSKMNEAAWIIGTLLCALGRVLCTKSGVGLSMIGAPPYIIHLKLAEKYPFFTQGTSEYVFQALLFVLVCAILRTVKVKHLFSFITAVILGIVIDGWLFVFGGNSVYDALWLRIICFVFGELFTAISIAFLFRTSLPLQMYEVFVLEIASKFNIKKDAVKLWFDAGMLVLSVLLALILNGNLAGVGIGTIIITVVNAPLIKLFGKLLDRMFIFDLFFPSLGKLLK